MEMISLWKRFLPLACHPLLNRRRKWDLLEINRPFGPSNQSHFLSGGVLFPSPKKSRYSIVYEKKNKCKDIFRAFAIACGTVFYFIKMKKQNKTKTRKNNKTRLKMNSSPNMIQSVGSFLFQELEQALVTSDVMDGRTDRWIDGQSLL